MSWSTLARILFMATELVAIVLLVSVPEVPSALLSLILFAFLWRWILPPLSTKLSSGIAVLIVVSSGMAVFLSSRSQGEILGPGLILLHATLTLGKNYSELRYWRLGIAFLEVLLACVLYPEARMFLGIFAFVLFASLSMSFGFLEMQIAAAKGDVRQSRASFKLVGQLFLISTFIFLTSLAIFPLLPRSNWGGIGGNMVVNPGFTETISLRNSTLQWGRGTNEPLVTVMLAVDSPKPLVIPYGLLRMSLLDLFDGNEWVPLGKKSERLEFAQDQSSLKISVIREKLTSPTLPVPYFYEPVLESGDRIQRSSAGEWFYASFYHAKVNYGWREVVAAIKDPPINEHLKLPRSMTEKSFLENFSSKPPLPEESLDRKIRWIQNHFTTFRYDLDYQAGKDLENIIPRFLKEKSGHCELFATSTALYFRALGVPSRVVTGFRVGNFEKELTVVRSSQAHAWVEIWDEKRKMWIPLDFTPPAPIDSAWKIWMQDFLDLVFALWNRYVLSFEWDTVKFLHWGKVTPLAVGFIFLWLGWRFLKRSAQNRPLSTRPEVSAIWERASKEISRKGRDPEKVWNSLGSASKSKYLFLRFSPAQPSKEELQNYEAQLRLELWKSLQSEQAESLRR